MSRGRRKYWKSSKKTEILSNLKESKSFKTGYLKLTSDQDTSQSAVHHPLQAITMNVNMKVKSNILNAATCQSKERKR